MIKNFRNSPNLSKILKRVCAFAVAGTMFGSVSGCKNNDDTNEKKENSIVVTDELIEEVNKNILISEFINDFGTVDDEKSLYGDSNFTFITIEENNVPYNIIQKALNESKNVGLIVKPTDYTYASIYNTIDVVKSIISRYDINCPIFYDTSLYMDEDTIRANCLLADEFCKKLSANGCYTGLYIQQDDMEYFSNNFNEYADYTVNHYDKMIGINSALNEEFWKIDYEKYGRGNSLIFPDGTIIWKYQIYKLIIQNGFNRSENFISDTRYTVKNEDTLYSISEKYGIKVDNLAEYNNLLDNSISPNDVLVIPNDYTKTEMHSGSFVIENARSYNFHPQKNYLKGIDISEYQGNVNWDEINTDFAIIRICDFDNKDDDGNAILDEKFYQNIIECQSKGIKIGLYYFTRGTNEEELLKEVNFIIEKLSKINGLNLEFPIYMDIEDKNILTLMKNNPAEFDKMLCSISNRFRENGYEPGIYINKSNIDLVFNITSISQIWTTSPATYNDKIYYTDFYSLDNDELEFFVPDNPEYNIICQYTQNGKIDDEQRAYDFNFGEMPKTKKLKNN